MICFFYYRFYLSLRKMYLDEIPVKTTILAIINARQKKRDQCVKYWFKERASNV